MTQKKRESVSRWTALCIKKRIKVDSRYLSTEALQTG